MQSSSRICTIAVLLLSCTVGAIAAPPIGVRVWAPRGVEPGSQINVKVMVESGRAVGGLDFTLKYNDSLFSFISVDQDTGLNRWELFNITHDLPNAKVGIFTIADIDNGPAHPAPDDFIPKGAIANYKFFVAPNWLDSSIQRFEFVWALCGDNAASNTRGDTLILLNSVRDYDGSVLWVEPDSINYPESARLPNIGTPDSCLIAANKLLFDIDFRNGGAANYFVCGDADANGAVSIADAVAIIGFIFSGGAAPNPDAAGDVDCNSQVSIADAVYLINYIFAGGPAPCACQPGR